MKAVLKIIRILVVILIVKPARCQDGFNNQDILRIQKMASNDGEAETITSYSTNIIQRDPNSQSLSSVNMYQISDDGNHNDNYHRADRTRNRKVYRIKNPFNVEDNAPQQDVSPEPQDSDTGASNQYAAMQYSLPPEEFLQQIRENQYYQQQPQISTPAPNLGYTATPLPQLQYSTISSPSFDNRNQLSNQGSYLEPKSLSQAYLSTPNSYHFNGQNTYNLESISTPSPVSSYLSTSFPSSQFVDTPSNTYVSSSSPIYLSSPSNLPQYVSSPISNVQTVSSDYGTNRVTSTIGSNSLSYDNNDHNKKMQIDHYDNSAIGVRYPNNIQQQFSNDFVSTTVAPSSSLYPDSLRDWQNTMNANINALSKSLQEVSMTQYQNYPYGNNNQDTRNDASTNNDHNMNSDNSRLGNTPSANNIYMNYAQPDYQAVTNSKSRTRDLEQETGQSEYYSNGDYGWRMTGKKPLINYETFQSGNQARYQTSSNSDGAVSTMNFHMDTSRPYNQNSKSSADNKDAQDFARAAAKAHEQYKQQQLYANNYAANVNNNNNQIANSALNNYYASTDKQVKSKFPDNSNNYMYSNSQSDLITASPYYYSNTRENYVDSKNKQPFDHAKALKNIVPIDVSNVVSNSDSQSKSNEAETYKYNVHNFNKDEDQNIRTYYRPIVESYQKDKNSMFDSNFKTKPDEYLSADNSKHLDLSTYYGKQQQPQELNNNHGSHSGISPQQNFVTQVPSNYQDHLQSLSNSQPNLQRPQNQVPTDIASILKLNDIPYRLTQGQISESSRAQNNNIDFSSLLPGRINQNVDSHQIDVTNILNKLMLGKQTAGNINRPELELQGSNVLSNIHGYKVANPFNVDLKLVADLLKNKAPGDESHLIPIRDQINRQPIKLDLSQLQYLLKNENNGNLVSLNDGFSSFNSPYLDIYGSGRFPYQGVKYSRSEEEEESLIPIADASSTHPIGAVMEQDDSESSREDISSDMTAHGEEGIVTNFEDNRSKNSYKNAHRDNGERYHPNSLSSARHTHHRKYPNTDTNAPYPLLKPPPRTSSNRIRSRGKLERHSRRRRVNKPKLVRILKSEPLFEDDNDDDAEKTVPILLRPPPPVAEAKSDKVDLQNS